MDEKEIIDLYWLRSERAIEETAHKYGRFCYSIAYNILFNQEDSEECVNDTYLHAWNAIPPRRPNKLSAFVGKITRNLALKQYEKYTAAKRGGGQAPLALEELSECISSPDCVERCLDERMLVEALNRFLKGLPIEPRRIFLHRYWKLDSVSEIAREFGFSESKVKMSLMRTRGKLKNFLEQEGIEL
ncbi:MAG: sigma-70 family RNA polymerase sigma factor [Oscillospiraceae bacterium]|nr:sigma-70 family RNA polymerase sigma factor [Oscillospiraceae bacterium]